ncbi:hypothetical protein BD408DRAFT_178686 [Parasitella parasitica]|nr:hypothetical protein BD408DRAFT_178686 [Parasitella parasitica]
MQSKQPEGSLSPCSRSGEHKRRYSQPSESTSVRTSNSENFLQPVEATMGKRMEDRRPCGLTQQSTQTILKYEQQPICKPDRRIPTELDEEQTLDVSAVATHFSPSCPLCPAPCTEDLNHFFFICPTKLSVWRNTTNTYLSHIPAHR